MHDGRGPRVDRGKRGCQTPGPAVPPPSLSHYIAPPDPSGPSGVEGGSDRRPSPIRHAPRIAIPLPDIASGVPPLRSSSPALGVLLALAIGPAWFLPLAAQEPAPPSRDTAAVPAAVPPAPPPSGPIRPGAGTGAEEPVCPAGRVVELEIENGPIFDLEGREDSRFAWAFRLANRLHVETSPRFLRREMLLREGDCWDPIRASESARILREYRFLAQARLESTQEEDGDWRLRVVTRDEWTTKLKTTVRMDEGLRLERAAFVEENLAGRGITAGVFLQERREQRDYGIQLETPQTFGTRLDTGLTLGRTRVGSFVEQSVLYPFVGEVGRVGFRQRYARRESYFAYRMEDDERGRELLVPILEEGREATLALRLGVPGNLTLLGAGLSREGLSFPGYPESVEVALGGNYDDREPASPELVEVVERQEQPRTTTRVNFLLGQRSIRYVARRGLDALDGLQDVPVGTDLGIMLARSLGFLQGGQVDPVDDLFTRVTLFRGGATRSWVVNANVQVEGRQVYAGGPGGRGWRDVLAEGDLFLYGQPSWLPSQTLFLRLSAAGGWTVDTPFQLSLGGRTGVRGYAEGRFPGGRRIVFTLEDRIRVPWPAPDLIDTGVTLFVDAGAMFPGDVPFGRTSGLRAAMGGGLRLGFPQGTGGVVRVDLAFPLEAGNGPILRVSMGEIVGLLAGFLDEDMERSRRAGISQQFAGVGR